MRENKIKGALLQVGARMVRERGQHLTQFVADLALIAQGDESATRQTRSVVKRTLFSHSAQNPLSVPDTVQHPRIFSKACEYH